MQLALDDERQLLRDTLHDFAKDRIRHKCREWDEAGAIPDAALAEGWQLGLLATEPSALTNAIALEELSWGDLSYAIALSAPMHLAIPIALFGTAEEKAELLPKLAAEKPLASTAAWVEATRTWDLASPRTKAVKLGGDLVLSGVKAFVPCGATAARTVVYARSAPASGFEGVDAWLVDGKDAAGIRVDAREEAIGARGVTLSRLTLENAPAKKIGGERGVDYRRLAERALVGSAAAAVGVGRAACEYATAYAKERVTFGRPIAQYQSIAFKIADAATDVEAARWMTWKAATKIDRGEPALKEASLAFRFATDTAWRVADDGVQILGGHGVIRDHLAELFFRNARFLAPVPGALIV